MTIIRFDVIKAHSTKSGKCNGGCGKRLTRSKTFEMTVNPFNKNPDGTIKIREEVSRDVHRAAKEWNPIFCCDECW
jgi:hypothetical protein